LSFEGRGEGKAEGIFCFIATAIINLELHHGKTATFLENTAAMCVPKI
jgi:hypothetical protein